MLVRAKKLGYYGDRRQREGAVFELDEKYIIKGKDGSAVLPRWVEPVNEIEPVKRGKAKKIEQAVTDVETEII